MLASRAIAVPEDAAPNGIRAAVGPPEASTLSDRLARDDAVAPDIDAIDIETAVRLLHRGQDREGGPWLDRTQVADLIAHDRHIRRHDDVLLAVLVLDGDDLS